MKQYNFDVEVGKILNLMINSLYANKDVALRELVSNASDACDKMRYLIAQNSEIVDDELKRFNFKIAYTKSGGFGP